MNLRIQNFKCFAEQDIPLNQLTVLAGANAAGKSSVIQTLLLYRLTLERAGLIKNRDQTIPQGTSIPLNDSYCLHLGNSSEIYSTKATNAEIAFRLSLDQDNYKEVSYPINLRKAELTLTTGRSRSQGSIAQASIYQPSFHYLHAERYGPRLRQELSQEDFITTGPQGEYLAQVVAQYGFTHKVEPSRCYLDTDLGSVLLKDQLDLWMGFLMPGVKIDTTTFEGANVAQTRVATSYSEQNFSLATNVGFGISYVLPIVVSALVAELGAMLIVENPEAHLHPYSQSRVGRFLGYMAAAGLQVVVETHSEHVVNGVRIAALEQRSREGQDISLSHDQVTINFFSDDGSNGMPQISSIVLNSRADLSHWPAGFFDQTQRDFVELMTLKPKR